jgi:diguanylate cyclase (GGDEF)-like protein
MRSNIATYVTELRIQELEHELRLREREILLLRETAEEVSRQLHLDRLLPLIAERARDLINAETVLIPVLNHECREYTYRAGSGKDVEEIIGETLPLELGICGWVWRNKRPWWGGVIEELEPAERVRWEKEAASVIMVPLMGRNRILGGISGIREIGTDRFSERDKELLSLFATQVAIALENAITFEELENAKRQADEYQHDLQALNQELLETNRQLENLALYDSLTGLPNRNLLHDRVAQQIQVARREHGKLAIIMLDLDRFKEVNDTLGHQAGDDLLEQAGMRFREALRDADTIGRLGGDEFAVVLPGADSEAARLVATHLMKTLETPFDIKGTECLVDASAGISIHPQHGNDVSTLLRCADVAMYVAKQDRTGVFVYDPERDNHTLHHLTLMADLNEALHTGQFRLYYQPKLDCSSGVIAGVEALMRWQHPVRGFVAPGIFIPAMEQSGLIKRYTFWALDEAYRQCMEWNEAGYDLTVSVNISMYNLRDTQLLEHIQNLQNRWNPRPGALIMEITESAIMGDPDYVSAVLNRLSAHGIEFSIDDFGTGYSSLSHLKRLPVHELKIDKSFVKEMDCDEDDAAIVRSTIDLAHNMGLRVVAEGVESAGCLQILKQFGCCQAQGYFIARPVPPGELLPLLESGSWPTQRIPE